MITDKKMKEEKTSLKKTKSSKKTKPKKEKPFEWGGSPLPGHGSVFRRFFPNM